MTARYVRNIPGTRENVSAAVISGAVAASVGLAVFYLARIFLARDRLGSASEGGSEEALRTGE